MRPQRFLAIAALALVPVLPYVFFGCAGQDLPFHVTSWVEVRESWLSGHLVPGWSPGANFTLGDPHLLFYPPTSLCLGGLLALLLPVSIVPAVFVYIAVLLGGLCMYRAAMTFLAERDRLAAAALYMLNPYLLTTALVRFAAAELLVQAWLPLIALYLYRSLRPSTANVINGQGAVWFLFGRPDRSSVLMLGLLLGLTWATDIPAAIVLLYGMGAVAAISAWRHRSLAPFFRFVAAEMVGAILAAFYLLPVLAEEHWIDHAALVAHEPARLLFLLPQSGFERNILLFSCWLFAFVQALLVYLSLRKRSFNRAGEAETVASAFRDPAPGAADSTWIQLGLASLFFQLPFAYPLWIYLPELRAVQYPYRFLPLLGVALTLLLFSRPTPRSHRRLTIAVSALLAAVPLLLFLALHASPLNRVSLVARAAQWHRDGYAGAPEYRPVGAVRPIAPLRLDPATMSSERVDPSNFGGACRVESPASIPLRPSDIEPITSGSIFNVSASEACSLHLAVFFYPYWSAFDESHRRLIVSPDPVGRLLVHVPPGVQTVALIFDVSSRLRTASAFASVMSLILVVTALYFFRNTRRLSNE